MLPNKDIDKSPEQMSSEKPLLHVKEITPASAIACGKLPPTERSLTFAIFRRWSLRKAYDKLLVPARGASMTKQQLADGKAAAQAQQDNGGPKAENKLSGHEKGFFCRKRAEPLRARGASRTEQQLAWKGAKALLHRLSSDMEGKTFGPRKVVFCEDPPHDRANSLHGKVQRLALLHRHGGAKAEIKLSRPEKLFLRGSSAQEAPA